MTTTVGRRRATSPSRRTQPASGKWTGRTREYDLVKEFVVALLAVAVLTVALAAIFSSPDEHQIDISQWSRQSPNDFVLTAATELDGSSGTAG